MADLLQQIAEKTLEDLKRRKREVTFKELASFAMYEKRRLDFKEAISQPGRVNVIAEIKKASPSKGVIRDDFDPIVVADQYIKNGAAAISILTDQPFFKGSLQYLEKVAEVSPIPLLRKDFILDPYQVREAKAFGADAVLLIVTMYSGNQLQELLSAAREFEVDALVECYHNTELQNLDWNNVEIVGVNNRNLSTFEVNLHRGVEILCSAPEQIVKVSESGLQTPEDLKLLRRYGIDAALIGEHLMRQENIGKGLREILAGVNLISGENSKEIIAD